MSQVIVENDALNMRRQASRVQEHKIARDSVFVKWQSTATFGLATIGKVVGVVVMPIVVFWVLIWAAIALIVTIVSQIFRALGSILPHSK